MPEVSAASKFFCAGQRRWHSRTSDQLLGLDDQSWPIVSPTPFRWPWRSLATAMAWPNAAAACRHRRRSFPALIRERASASSINCFSARRRGRRRPAATAGSPTCTSATAGCASSTASSSTSCISRSGSTSAACCRTRKALVATAALPACLVEFGPVGCSIEVGYVSDGSLNAARGARGGGLGGPADHRKRKRDGSIEVLSNCAQVKLAEGETILSVCCGGGGYGAPDERDPLRVIHDFLEGRISRVRAREIYKVVIDQDGRYDEAATSALRSRT